MHPTVSRVINGHPYVKESTRQRVLEVIQDMAYRPSVTARALSRGAGRAVTVLTSDLTRYSRAALLQGVEEAARAAGFSVGVSTLDSPQPHEVARSVERVCDPRTSGIIVIADDLAGVRALRAVHLRPRRLPDDGFPGTGHARQHRPAAARIGRDGAESVRGLRSVIEH